tara:strand:- start:9903 stop:11042 length:1140 start_codon:yes stop_codon:yes gene_type:complete
MPLSTTITEAVSNVHRDALTLEAIANGPATGATSLVALVGGLQQKTAARAIAEMLAAGQSVDTLLVSDGVPDNSIGLDGQGMVDFNTGIIYTRTVGVYVAESETTSPQRIYISAATPLVGFGNDGDIAFISDGTDFNKVVQKEVGAWVDKGSLIPSPLVVAAADAFFANEDVVGSTAALFVGSLGFKLWPVTAASTVTVRPNFSSAVLGGCQLLGGTVANDASKMIFDHSNSIGNGIFTALVLKDSGAEFQWKFKLHETTCEYWIGLLRPFATEETVNGRAMGVKIAGGGTFKVSCLGSGGETEVDTTINLDSTTFHTLKIRWDEVGDVWKLVFDGIEHNVLNKISDGNQLVPGLFMKNISAAQPGVVLSRFKLLEPAL